MVARKQFLEVRAADPDLMKLLGEAKGKKVTSADLQEQRVSFAFGNAPDSKFITKDSVRAASHSLLLAN